MYLRVSLKRGAPILVNRLDLGRGRLVYVLVASRSQNYRHGRSRIVYIGTTAAGMKRIATSAAHFADKILALHGVREFEARIVTCQGRRNVKSWHKLERALLLQFREMYGEIPFCNTQGVRMIEQDEFRYFRRDRIRSIITELG
jgi:hypothetical protein